MAVARSRRSSELLLASSALASVSGILTSLSTPSDGNLILLSPMLLGLLGAVASGFFVQRTLLVCVLAVLFTGGWYVGLLTTWGLLPPGVNVGVGALVLVAVFPLDAVVSKLIVAAATTAVALSGVTVFVVFMEWTASARVVAAALNAVAASAYAVAFATLRRRTKVDSP